MSDLPSVQQELHEAIYRRGYEAGVDAVQDVLSESHGMLILPDDVDQIMGEVRKALRV